VTSRRSQTTREPHLYRLSHALLAAVLALSAAVATQTVAPSTAAPVTRPVADRPNIVLITTDDQSEEDLRFMPLTRRLLGGAGTTFTDAVAPFPLCCPARATLVTGQLAHNHGVLSNKGRAGGYQALRPINARTLPVALQVAGYRTSFTGKYLNGYGKGDPTEVPPGWDNWHGAVGKIYDFYNNSVNENGTVVGHTGTYQADLTQDVTEDAIREGAETGQPFFVLQSNLAPHSACVPGPKGGCRWAPPQPALEDVDKFADLPLRRRQHHAFNERAVADKPDFIARSPMTRRAQQRMHDYQVARARSLQAVDRNVADTVRLLDSLGQLDNTLIIFTSDNGFLLGEHRRFAKTVAYEPSLHVPLLMRGPGTPAGVVTDEMVSLVDVPATITRVGGAVPLLEPDGRSLLPVAQGGKGYDAVSIESGSVMGAPAGQFFSHGVRTARYTYVEYPLTGEAELYDRRLDPHQLDNAAYRPTHRDTRAALVAMLDRLRFCTGVDCTNVSGSVPDPLPPQGPVHPDELTSLGGATQVVIASASHWSAGRGQAVAWRKRGRSWRAVRSFPVTFGTRGLARPEVVRTHQRGLTPVGSFGVDRAVGLRPDPGAKLTYRRLDAQHRWSHDPRSPQTYNVLQSRRPPWASWRPALEERFARTPRAFRHALVLDHNLPRRIRSAAGVGQRVAASPADVRKGSLLLHTGRRVGDHGWMAAAPRRTRWLVRWLAPAQRPRFVVGPERYLRNNL
jgi:N-acetylglucosamine-6-sulfatase